MIVLVGGSASGKSTVEKILCNKYGYKNIVSYTTRQPRAGEVDGIDYHFISESEFFKLKTSGFFAEVGEYNGWFYGSSVKDCTNDKIAVLTPHGMRQLKCIPGLNLMCIYIKVDRRDRLIKILQRNDNIEEAKRRDASDVGQFDGIEDEVNLVIENDNYKFTPEEIAEKIYHTYQAFRKENRNKRLTILCDIDEVVNNLVESLLNKYNEKYNDKVTINDIKDWDISKAIKPECKNFFEEFCTEKSIESLDLQPKAKDVVNYLMDNHDFYFVSSTHPENVRAKNRWLQKHFSKYDTSKLIICKNKALVHGDILIDDCLDNFSFKHGKNNVRYNLIFDKPWNHETYENSINTFRVKNWEDVNKVIGDIVNEN